MKNLFIFIFLISLLIGNQVEVFAQNSSLNWLHLKKSLNITINDFVRDPYDGSVYIVGEFFGTVDFDPSNQYDLLTDNGSGDIYIHKLVTQEVLLLLW